MRGQTNIYREAYEEYLELLGFERGTYKLPQEELRPPTVPDPAHLKTTPSPQASTRLLMLGVGFAEATPNTSSPAHDLLHKMIAAMGAPAQDWQLNELPSDFETIVPEVQALQPEALILWAHKPDLIALENLAPKLQQITNRQGSPLSVHITHHPEDCLTQAHLKKYVWEELQIVMQRLGYKK